MQDWLFVATKPICCEDLQQVRCIYNVTQQKPTSAFILHCQPFGFFMQSNCNSAVLFSEHLALYSLKFQIGSSIARTSVKILIMNFKNSDNFPHKFEVM